MENKDMALPQAARAGRASPQAPTGLGHSATIANAAEMLEAAYKDGYFAGVKDPDVENVTAMFLHSETARACRAHRDIAEIGRLRMFLVTIMVNCERSPNLTKDDIHDLCVGALNGKTVGECVAGTPIRPRAQGTSGSAQDVQRLDPKDAGPVSEGNAP